jgi:hypothetical protein
MASVELHNESKACSKNQKHSATEAKYPTHIMVPIWIGVIAVSLLFWTLIAQMVLDF